MSNQPEESRANKDLKTPLSLYRLENQTLQTRLDTLFSPLSYNQLDVSSPFYHGCDSNLLEIHVVLPSVSYLRRQNGNRFSSVPKDVLSAYVKRSIDDTHKHRDMFASDPSPNISAWWIAGEVLHLIGNLLDQKAITWWQGPHGNNHFAQQPSPSTQLAPFSVFSSDLFSLSFRTFDHMASNLWAEKSRCENQEKLDDLRLRIRQLHIEKQQAEKLANTRDNSASIYEATIRKRDEQVSSLEATIRERDGQVSSLEATIRERDGQVSSLEATIRERNGQISGLKATERHNAVMDLTPKTQNPATERTEQGLRESFISGAGEMTVSGSGLDDREIVVLRSKLAQAETMNGRLDNHIQKLREIIRNFEFESMTVDKLRMQCRERKMSEVSAKLRKAEIINLLKLHDKNRLNDGDGRTQTEIEQGMTI